MNEIENSSDDELMELPDTFAFEKNLTDDPSHLSEAEESASAFPTVEEPTNGDATASSQAGNDSKDEEPVTVESYRAKPVPKYNFEVIIKPPPAEVLRDYTPIPAGDEIYRVLAKIPPTVSGESWFKVEYEDGHEDIVSTNSITSYR